MALEIEVEGNLVIELRKEETIENDNTQIRTPQIQEIFIKLKETWTYLKEGGLIPFMERIEGHDEKVT